MAHPWNQGTPINTVCNACGRNQLEMMRSGMKTAHKKFTGGMCYSCYITGIKKTGGKKFKLEKELLEQI